MPTDDLAAFVRARIEETEKASSALHLDANRRFRHVEGIRALIDSREACRRMAADLPDADARTHWDDQMEGLTHALRCIALTWSDHPDYRAAWRPDGSHRRMR